MGNGGKARGLSGKKYARGSWAQNQPSPGRSLGSAEWENAKNALGKRDPWAKMDNEGIINDSFCVSYLS